MEHETIKIEKIDLSNTLSECHFLNHIHINENIKDLHIHYKDKEYVFDLEKALEILFREIK